MTRETITVKEVGEMLGIGRLSAYQAVRTGELPSIRIGRRLLVPKRGIEQLLETGNFPRKVDK